MIIVEDTNTTEVVETHSESIEDQTSLADPIEDFEEGIISDMISGVGIDTAQVKADWANDEDGYPVNNTRDRLRSVNDNVLDPARRTADSLDKLAKRGRVDTRSIVSRAKNSVLQFPVYITQTLRVNEATVISRFFERVYTTLVQTVLSQNQIIDEEDANNLAFLKQFHSNIKESAEALTNIYYQPIDDVDAMMQESLFHVQKINENCTVEFRLIPTTDRDLILENARLIHDPLAGFAYLKEDETAHETNGKFINLNGNDIRDMAVDRAGLNRRELDLIDKNAQQIENEVKASMPDDDPESDEVKAEIAEQIRQRGEALDKLNAAENEIKNFIRYTQYDNDTLRDEYDLSDSDIRLVNSLKNMGYSHDGIRYRKYDKSIKNVTRQNGAPVDAPVILKDTDIKKMNDMLPLTIQATFRLRTRNGLDRDVRYIIGVKADMHLIRTQDLADDLRDLVTGNIKNLRKVRYKTGEINFMDYYFNINQIKADAAKNIDKNKRWVNTLKRLSDYQQMNGSLLKKPIEAITNGGVPIPNGTLVLSQPDVTTLTNQTGIDLSVIDNAKKLAKNLFLVCVAIVDSSAGTMRVLFYDPLSNQGDWDVQSLDSINAEINKSENGQVMKELNHLVNR